MCVCRKQAQHLTRAVSTLLKLTAEEEKLLKETLEWKMSWYIGEPFDIERLSIYEVTPL